jgi:hypothetical protein
MDYAAAEVEIPGVQKRLPGRQYDHVFFSATSILILICVLIGFGPTYFFAGVFRAHLPNLIIHFHAAVFSCWIFSLVIQTTLVSAGRVDIHRRFGLFVFGLACLMVILGLLAGANLLERNFAPRGMDARTFYVIPFSEMVMFPVLVLLAYRARRDPAAHKRFILIATVALLGVAFTRFHVALLHRTIFPALFASYSFLLLLALYDLWSMRKLHRTTWSGSALVIGVGLLRFPFAHTAAWQVFAAWVQSHARWLL